MASRSLRVINLAWDVNIEAMQKTVLAYVLTILIFGSGIYAVIHAGKKLEAERNPAQTVTQAQSPPSLPIAMIRDNLREPMSRLLLQIIIIVIVARLFGALLTRLGQPAVIGEMIAGIVLGPSVVGALFPNAFQFIFPAESLGILRMLSQVGVILFMFIVGMELDINHLRNKPHVAVVVSHVSIVFPYFLGVLCSLFLYRSLALPNASFLAFALFMGIAMSITAFPVLARILEERNLTTTFLGATSLTCAAIGDVSAWAILAVVVAIVKAGGIGSSLYTILFSLLFIAFVLFVVKPWSSRSTADRPGKGFIVLALIVMFSFSLFTEVIGIHAIFGAFLAGVAMPPGEEFRRHLKERIETFGSGFLLPLFFAFVGLRTQIGLLNSWQGWLICGALIFAATLGKLGGSMIAARWTGMKWRDSFALGALMNTRGLVELIVLNIGLDLGILSPQVFAMMVLMALVTTFLTGPFLSLAQPKLAENAALSPADLKLET